MQVPWLRQGLDAHSLMLVWQFGPVGKADNTLHTCQFRRGSTAVHAHTTILTSEAHATGANVSTGHVLAGASIHARVGFTLIVVDVTVFTTPARVTQAFIANRKKVLKSESS